MEIPTNDETNDNIVAYWTPDQLPEAGKEMNFKYTMTFTRDEEKLHAPENAGSADASLYGRCQTV